MSRPTALSVRPGNIPDALKAERRWVVWKYVWDHHRWAKVLCTPSTGRYAKTNDSSMWTSFDEAFAVYIANHYDGIGSCLGDGWAGADLDGITSGGPVDRLCCYKEISTSGTGVRAIGRSARIGVKSN
jgi:primase-polymerase (primpol)-like protein